MRSSWPGARSRSVRTLRLHIGILSRRSSRRVRISQAHEALRRYLAVPGVPATVAALKQETAKYVNERDDPRYVEKWDQLVESMRKAGLPEE